MVNILDAMKKIVVSTLIVFGFAFYALFQRRAISSQSESLPATSLTLPVSDNTNLNTSNSINAPSSSQVTSNPSATYKDGSFTGIATDAYYGNIQVKAAIKNGKITNVQFLQHPDSHSRSILINQIADPILASEAIQAQSASVDNVSGATDTSRAFVESLSSALSQAKN
ncbi:MAG: FMN-binding protein [Candidatus Paceibacterales bacterium]